MLAILSFIGLWSFFVVIVISKLVSNVHFALVCVLFSTIYPIIIISIIIYSYEYFFVNQNIKISYLKFLLCVYCEDQKIRSWKVYIYIPTFNIFLVDEKSGDILHLEGILDSDQYLYFTEKILGKISAIKGKTFAHTFKKVYYNSYNELPTEIAIIIKIFKNFLEEKIIFIAMQEETSVMNPYLCSTKVESIYIH